MAIAKRCRLSASIARDIVKERRALGLTQAQLAKLAGIRQDTLSRLESGKYKPIVRTVERVEAALKRKQTKKRLCQRDQPCSTHLRTDLGKSGGDEKSAFLHFPRNKEALRNSLLRKALVSGG
jgi:transcriptional regulator with XRE-family HTH domain